MSEKNSRGSALNWTSLFKWALAVGLVTYLIRSDRLSFSELGPLFSSPEWTLLILVGVYALLAVGFWRWRILVQRLGVQMSFFDAMRLGMVGAFFSAVLPGTVSGDVVKAVYVARRYPSRRTLTVSSVLLDRGLGLVALIGVGGVGYLLGRERIEALADGPRLLMTTLGHLLVWGLAASLAGLVLVPLLHEKLRALVPPRFRAMRLGRILDDVLRIYGSQAAMLWFVYGLSFVIHVANLGLMYGMAQLLFGHAVELPFSLFVMAASMGLCAMSLPIAPMGLGVGQLAFASMFQALAVSPPSFGATLITGFQALSLIVNLSGGLFYLTYRHEVPLSDVEGGDSLA